MVLTSSEISGSILTRRHTNPDPGHTNPDPGRGEADIPLSTKGLGGKEGICVNPLVTRE